MNSGFRGLQHDDETDSNGKEGGDIRVTKTKIETPDTDGKK